MDNCNCCMEELEAKLNQDGRLSKFIIKNFLMAGRAFEKGFKISDADPRELEIGIKIEYEHTKSTALATRIALDHLSEIRDYYTRLVKMEMEAKRELGLQGE